MRKRSYAVAPFDKIGAKSLRHKQQAARIFFDIIYSVSFLLLPMHPLGTTAFFFPFFFYKTVFFSRTIKKANHETHNKTFVPDAVVLGSAT